MARPSATHCLRLGVLLASMPALSGAKCFDYEPELSRELAQPQQQQPSEPNSCQPPAPPPPSVEAMRGEACIGTRCYADDVVAYWKPHWDEHARERTIVFQESGPDDYSFEVTDASGAAAALEFAAGVPVTLTLVNPAQASSGPHDLTAPSFFRSVAWWKVETSGGEYLAPTFDAIGVSHSEDAEHRAVLRFVPIKAGEYTAWSAEGVDAGRQFADIVTGEVSPDLQTGDAGAGMVTSIKVVPAGQLTLFQGGNPNRELALDQDPRRSLEHDVWEPDSLHTVRVEARESLDPQTGASVFTFDWSTRQFKANAGTVLEIRSGADNEFQHDITAPDLVRDSVTAVTRDAQARVYAPYLDSIHISPDTTIEMLFVPTVVADYRVYCGHGVVHDASGEPDLETGHAKAGMHDWISVAPP